MELHNNRISWIDMAKGYGIILVIVGHLHLPSTITNYIYSFHIPLFFFLSGYLFNTKKSFKDFVATKIKRLIIPYICLCIPMIFSNLLFSENYTFNFDCFKIELVCFLLQERHTTLWFLACLLILNIIMYLVVKYSTSKWLSDLYCMLFCLSGLILWHFGIKDLIWNCDLALVVLPFFYAGYRFRNLKLFLNIHKLAFPIITIMVILMGTIIFFLNNLNVNSTGVRVDFFYSNINIVGITYLVAFIGITMMVLVSMGYNNKLIRYIGENSLLYFAWHQTIIFPVLSRICWKIDVIQYDVYHGTYLFPCITFFSTFFIITILNEIISHSNYKFILGK